MRVFHCIHAVAYTGEEFIGSDPIHNGIATIDLDETNPSDRWYGGPGSSPAVVVRSPMLVLGAEGRRRSLRSWCFLAHHQINLKDLLIS